MERSPRGTKSPVRRGSPKAQTHKPLPPPPVPPPPVDTDSYGHLVAPKPTPRTLPHGQAARTSSVYSQSTKVWAAPEGWGYSTTEPVPALPSNGEYLLQPDTYNSKAHFASLPPDDHSSYSLLIPDTSSTASSNHEAISVADFASQARTSPAPSTRSYSSRHNEGRGSPASYASSPKKQGALTVRQKSSQTSIPSSVGTDEYRRPSRGKDSTQSIGPYHSPKTPQQRMFENKAPLLVAQPHQPSWQVAKSTYTESSPMPPAAYSLFPKTAVAKPHDVPAVTAMLDHSRKPSAPMARVSHHNLVDQYRDLASPNETAAARYPWPSNVGDHDEAHDLKLVPPPLFFQHDSLAQLEGHLSPQAGSPPYLDTPSRRTSQTLGRVSSIRKHIKMPSWSKRSSKHGSEGYGSIGPPVTVHDHDAKLPRVVETRGVADPVARPQPPQQHSLSDRSSEDHDIDGTAVITSGHPVAVDGARKGPLNHLQLLAPTAFAPSPLPSPHPSVRSVEEQPAPSPIPDTLLSPSPPPNSTYSTRTSPNNSQQRTPILKDSGVPTPRYTTRGSLINSASPMEEPSPTFNTILKSDARSSATPKTAPLHDAGEWSSFPRPMERHPSTKQPIATVTSTTVSKHRRAASSTSSAGSSTFSSIIGKAKSSFTDAVPTIPFVHQRAPSEAAQSPKERVKHRSRGLSMSQCMSKDEKKREKKREDMKKKIKVVGTPDPSMVPAIIEKYERKDVRLIDLGKI